MKRNDRSDFYWRKSTYSGPTGGDCVELAGAPSMVAIRDSKNPELPHLTFGRVAFSRLVRKIRSGQHDL
ncbi:DUF397 domain-containing protein [Actinocorallia populi]|uniref:DUF397 domain-containing protein n=1 Tax=Actinocorallia populi TaxID=2079200 RepID=UPI000D08E778|nr:DUF397 domain-containing protein [Actinocorallia populi]